eukprot:scaffold2.g6976.t1
MLARPAQRLLPALAGTSRGIAAAGPALSGTESRSGNTYEDFKRAAQKTGDAAKARAEGGAQEWIQGTREHAPAGAALRRSAEEAIEATKRAAADVTSSAKEAVQGHGKGSRLSSMDEKGNRVEPGTAWPMPREEASGIGQQFSQTASSAKEHAGKVVEQVAEGLGLAADRPNIQSARAETRRPEAQAGEAASRKDQLLDEASSGDNATEARARDDKRILPNDFYTKH